MRDRLQRSAWSAAAAAALGGVTSVTALASLDPSDTGCTPQVPVLASLGIHLDFVAGPTLCSEHGYLLGTTYAAGTQLWLLFSTVTWLAGTLGVLAALAAGLSAIRALRSARGWLQGRLMFGRLRTPAPLTDSVGVAGPEPVYARARYYLPLQRRGPPVCFC